jgi:hypothetical protein
VGCPIRRSTDQTVFAPPRSLSQRITSFIACACQGIHQMPLRHLIVLIANTRQDCSRSDISRKTSFSRYIRWLAVKLPIIMRGIEHCHATYNHKSESPGRLHPNISSLHNFNRTGQLQFIQSANFFSSVNDMEQPDASIMQVLVEPDGIEPTTPCLQSRCSPS